MGTPEAKDGGEHSQDSMRVNVRVGPQVALLA